MRRCRLVDAVRKEEHRAITDRAPQAACSPIAAMRAGVDAAHLAGAYATSCGFGIDQCVDLRIWRRPGEQQVVIPAVGVGW